MTSQTRCQTPEDRGEDPISSGGIAWHRAPVRGRSSLLRTRDDERARRSGMARSACIEPATRRARAASRAAGHGRRNETHRSARRGTHPNAQAGCVSHARGVAGRVSLLRRRARARASLLYRRASARRSAPVDRTEPGSPPRPRSVHGIRVPGHSFGAVLSPRTGRRSGYFIRRARGRTQEHRGLSDEDTHKADRVGPFFRTRPAPLRSHRVEPAVRARGGHEKAAGRRTGGNLESRSPAEATVSISSGASSRKHRSIFARAACSSSRSDTTAAAWNARCRLCRSCGPKRAAATTAFF